MAELKRGLHGFLRTARREVTSRLHLARARRDPPLLVIYSPGKTGTTTLASALERAGKPPIKVHSIGPLDAELAELRRAVGGIPAPHTIYAKRVREAYVAGDSFRLLTGVRDPVARSVSRAFQAPEVHGLDPDATAADFRNWIRADLERNIRDGGSMSWYRLDFAEPLGLDLSKIDFHIARGIGWLKGPRADCLMYRADKLDTLAEEIGAFCGTTLNFARENARRDTGAATLYGEVRDTFRLPAPLMDEILSDPLMAVYFSDAERDGIAARWTA